MKTKFLDFYLVQESHSIIRFFLIFCIRVIVAFINYEKAGNNRLEI